MLYPFFLSLIYIHLIYTYFKYISKYIIIYIYIHTDEKYISKYII